MAGLYIHIPFCHSKCSYCDFFSTPRVAGTAAYIEALVREFDLRRDEISEPFTTVYIGGGTPSILSGDMMSRLITELRRRIDFGAVTEFTVEANPEDVTPRWIESVTALGVNRVSMGVQSFDDAELRAINRRHDAATAMRAIGVIARTVPNFSCDLIYGLPGQSSDSWRRSLDRLISFNPPHISAYLLSYEPGTRLYAQLVAGKIAETPDDIVMSMYDILTDSARAAGYNHYEISNFALPGMEAKHNSSYWDSTPYLGLGVSAHSFDGRVRRHNPSDIPGYIAATAAGKIQAVAEDETATERFNDYIITRLRTAAGIDLSDLTSRWPPAFAARLSAESRRHVASGCLVATSSRLYIPERYFLTADSVLRDLIITDDDYGAII